MENVHKYISNSISRHKKGDLIFPSDFRGIGAQSAIRMSLSRLTKVGRLRRLAHGIYFVPKIDPLFGEIYPSPEQVAESVAKKGKVKIMPAGANALHTLGLTTQVPTKMVYLTDGEDRQIRMGKMLIQFKATTPKRLAMVGELSSLVILALEELGIENIPQKIEEKIKAFLHKEDPAKLRKDLALATGRIHDYIIHLIKK
jgi:Family of unknown function (DUF6088)